MAKRRDYIPSNLDDFHAFERHLHELLAKHAKEWGIAAAAVKELAGHRTAYMEAYGRYKDAYTRSKKDVAEHDAQRENYTRALRDMVQSFLVRNRKIDLVTKVAAGLTTDKPRRRKLKKIDEVPMCLPDSHHTCAVRFSCYTQTRVGRPKLHDECHAVELEYMLLDEHKAVDLDFTFEATGRHVSSRAQFTLRVGRSGQWLYCRVRWINTSDDSRSSGWSDVRKVLVH